MEVDIAGDAVGAGVVACAVSTGRDAGIANGALRVGTGGTSDQADIVVEIAADTRKAKRAIGAVGTVSAALAAGDVCGWVVEDGAGGKAEAVELDEPRSTLDTEVVGSAVYTIRLASLTLIVVCYGLGTCELARRAALSTG